jgi:hypothetical protein
MPDEREVPPADSMSGYQNSQIVAAGGIALPPIGLSGTLTVADVRDAVQELCSVGFVELRRLLAEYYQAGKAGHTTDTDTLAAKVETTTRMVKVARLLRVGAKWGAVTILASLIGAPVDHEVSDLMGWTPPPITIVVKMSPAQRDELSHQILQQLEQMYQRQHHR